MRIEVTDFYSIKRLEMELKPGINVLVGKNGSGKSQLLMAIASTAPTNPLQEYGFAKNYGGKVSLHPPAEQILWRPPVRRLTEENRRIRYATLGPTTEYMRLEDGVGYTY